MIENITDIKVCTCAQCRRAKSKMRHNTKVAIRRMLNKKRRVGNKSVINFYHG